MDIQEYQKHARRTMNKNLNVDMTFAVMALGVCGEAAELAKLHDTDDSTPEKVMDEGGDVVWYVTNLCSMIGVQLEKVLPIKVYSDYPKETVHEIQTYAGGLADVIKKTVGQGHELDVSSVETYIGLIMGSLCDLFFYYKLSFEEVCEYNHLKLMKRYAKGFSSEASINRKG